LKPLVWFRTDLRTADNPALHGAAILAAKGPVVSVFLCTPEQWREHDWGDHKVGFLLRNLAELSKKLASLGIALHIETVPRFRDAPECLARFARKHRCDALFFNREYEVNERRRDHAVERRFAEEGIRVHGFMDQTVFQPGELLSGSGGFYTVFTPFRNAFMDRLRREGVPEPLPPPRRRTLDAEPDRVPRSVGGFDSARSRPGPWPAGEDHALARLDEFLAARSRRYGKERDLPGADGTSRLSPYLALGAVSVRQCLAAAALENGGKPIGGSHGIATWINGLVWREFYRHVLVGFPRVSRSRPFPTQSDDVPWRHDEEAFLSWCEGRTGYPIVDAGMRQLTETGWMHNRLRMITAMFLTKHLLVDWRWGERHFMRSLVDGDLANNNGGWQWSASTGTDAAPYFRIFNPWTQSRRFDPEGRFIHRFVPELRHVPSGALHAAGRLADARRGGVDYPPPIVEHAEARARALRAFEAVRRARGRPR
jgi:deoxyribodipyrimidine photo-lyase